MKKSTFFVISILITLLILLVPVKSFATADVKTWDEMAQQAQEFLNQGKATTVISSDDVANTIMPIAQALVAFASAVLVVVTLIMGIKYATATSPDVQAKLKKQMIGLVVSIIVVFGAQAIWAIVYNFMKDF